MRTYILAVCSFALAGFAQAEQPETTPPAKPVEVDFVKETGFTYGPWRSSVMGSGGYVQNVVACPSNPQRFYTYVDVGGTARSDDGGKTWRMLHGAMPAGVAYVETRGLIVDPRDDNRIVIAVGSSYGSGGGVFASSDAGNTFKQVLDVRYAGNGGSRSTGFILARSAQNPDLLVTASIESGVFLSKDNGETWTSIGAKDLYPTDVRFDRTDSNRIWLCTSGEKWKKNEHTKGFHLTEDGGKTWQNVATNDSPSEIVQDPKNAGELFGIFNGEIIKKSTDLGRSWVPFSEGLPIEPLEPGKSKPSISNSGYRAITTGPDFILTGVTKGALLFKLRSGGTRWEALPEREQPPEDGDWFHHGGNTMGWALGSITVDPHNADHWFITDFFAIYQTFDAGRSWRLTIDGMETTVSHCGQQDPTDPGVVHIGVADVGAFVSENGGVRFRQSKVPHLGPDRAGGGNMKCIDLNPKLPSRLYGIANRNYYAGWRPDQVYVSIDRGESWHRSPMTGLPDLAKNPATTIVTDLKDPYTCYLTVAGTLARSGGIFKSTDGGASWAPMNQGLPVGEYCFPYEIWAHGRQMAIDTDGTMIALNISGNRVYRFDAKEQTWSTTSLRGNSGRLWSVVADRLSPGTFFVGVRGDGIYRTRDGGLTWERVYDKSASYLATDAVVSGRVAAGTLEGVILSTDGGDSWTMLDQRLPHRHDNIPTFAGERLIVGSTGSGAFWMPLSPEGEKPVTARPMVPATLQGSSNPLPSLINSGFDAADFAGWTLEANVGNPRLELDNKSKRQGSASLKIVAPDDCDVTLYQDFKITRLMFGITGNGRSQGSLKNVTMTLEPFDAHNQSLGVIPFHGLNILSSSWKDIFQMFAVPPMAVRARLALHFKGTGEVSLDNFKVREAGPYFPE